MTEILITLGSIAFCISASVAYITPIYLTINKLELKISIPVSAVYLYLTWQYLIDAIKQLQL